MRWKGAAPAPASVCRGCCLRSGSLRQLFRSLTRNDRRRREGSARPGIPLPAEGFSDDLRIWCKGCFKALNKVAVVILSMMFAVAACAFDIVLHRLTACAGADLRRQSLRHRPTLLPMRANSTLDEAVRSLLTNPGRCRGRRGAPNVRDGYLRKPPWASSSKLKKPPNWR